MSKRHAPLNLPKDRTKQIQRAIDMDEEFISAGYGCRLGTTEDVLAQLIAMLCERQILPWDEAQRMCDKLKGA